MVICTSEDQTERPDHLAVSVFEDKTAWFTTVRAKRPLLEKILKMHLHVYFKTLI